MTFVVKPRNPQACKASPSKIPQIPGLIVAVAPIRSGKTLTITNLLTSKHAWKNKFENVWVFSPSCKYDQTWQDIMDIPILKKRTSLNSSKHFNDDRDLCIAKENLITDPDGMLPKLKEIMDQQDPDKRDYEEQPYKIDEVAVVIDDMAGTSFIKSRYLDNCLSRLRHSHITFVFCVQMFKSLTPLARNNCRYYIVFRTDNNRERFKLWEECGGRFTFDQFNLICDEVWAKDYAALGISMTNSAKFRLIDNFTHYMVKSNDVTTE